MFVKRLVGAAVAAALAIPLLLGGAAPAQAAPTSVYGIYNSGSVGLGVLQNWRTSGSNYDRILPSGNWTDYNLGWGHAGGVYIGSGYCAARYTSATGQPGTWNPAGSDFRGPNRFRLAGNYFVQIYPYHC
ncbi:hypothetical protein ACQP2Y_11235 [Actinoplanes sp. CA-051413]|uniref:hypothetical protein n=1 Tax=Actinoplanes sp. CA-051413 TaxID=3239899 RepID=UPI003D97A1FA